MIALLLALAACSTSGVPSSARAPVAVEAAIIEDARSDYAAHPDLPPVGAECARYLDRVRIVDADRWDMLALCWRDEPGHCGADADSRSRYGCAAGCAITRSTCSGVASPAWSCTPHPVLVIAQAQPPDVRLAALRHEITHALAYRPCVPIAGANEHTTPALWGPGGVTPL